MTFKYKKTTVSIINGIILFIFCIFQYSPVNLFNIGIAVPVLGVCLTVGIAYYFGESSGAVWGIATGICMDALSSGRICFSTVCLCLIGLIGGLFMTYMLNRNFPSLCLFSITASAVYFLADWIVYLIFTANDAAAYLVSYSFPSLIYTSIIGIIFTLLYGIIIKRNIVKV